MYLILVVVVSAIAMSRFSAPLSASEEEFQCSFCTRSDFGRPTRIEFESSKIIAYRGASDNRNVNQIEVYTERGETVVALNPLSNIDGARQIAIWDVSMGPSNIIAVALVAVNEDATRASLLMVYSGSGKLLNTLAFDRQIMKAAVDGDGNVWILWMDAGSGDPALRSLISKYNSMDRSLKDFIPRSEFPQDARVLRQGPGKNGIVSFGLAGEDLWAFLPADRELVTMRLNGASTKIDSLSDPFTPDKGGYQPVADLQFYETYKLPSGRVVTRVFSRTNTNGQVSILEWDKTSGKWRDYGIKDDQLLGAVHFAVENDQLIFVAVDGGSETVRIRRISIPPQQNQ
jgi:hypothetical protein